MKLEILKADDNWQNSFLTDEDKIGDQIIASIEIDGVNFYGMGDNKDTAIEDLREHINGHYNAKKHLANIEINKAINAIGLHSEVLS